MDVARLLINHGAKLEDQALRFLALKNTDSKPHDALEIISAGISPDGAPGREPLRIAARSGHAEFCQILLNAGARPLPEALIDAVKSGDLETVKVFWNKRIGDRHYAARLAAKRKEKEILNFIFQTSPSLADSALIGAIEGCDFRTARKLLKSGANANYRDAAGQTPLMTLYAIDRRTDQYRFMANDPERYKGDWNFTRHPWKPDIDEYDNPDKWQFYSNRPDNWNELLALAEDDALALALEMIDRGADIQARDNQGRTALWHACSMSWRKSIKILVDMGLNINERDENGDSPFDAGCLCGEPLTIKPMIVSGAELDARDRNGDTALIKCAKRCLENKNSGCSSAIIALLSDFNADADLKNNADQSLRSMFSENKDLNWMLDYIETE